jgi:hypothetical protein
MRSLTGVQECFFSTSLAALKAAISARNEGGISVAAGDQLVDRSAAGGCCPDGLAMGRDVLPASE